MPLPSDERVVAGHHDAGRSRWGRAGTAHTVGREQRQVGRVLIGELDAKQRCCVGLDNGPSGEATEQTSSLVKYWPSLPGSRFSSSRPVARGLPSASSAYSRRNTWCEGCEV